MAFSREQYEAFNELNSRGALSEERKQAFSALRERGAFKEFEPVQEQQQIPSMEDFLQTVPAYEEDAPQTTDPMSVAGIPGSQTMGESQGAKGLTREAMPVLRPALEAGASVAGALIAAPTTPVGQAAAGALGYGIGAKAANIIEGWAQNRKDERPQPETITGKVKQFAGDVSRETMQSAKDIAFGATMEMGGQLAVKGISATAKFAMNKLKDIGKALPPLTRAGATQRAGQVLAAQTKDGPLIAQNIAEAEALEEAIPGLRFRRGQLTNDPSVIKFERAQARMTGDAAQEQLEQEARNSKAIRDFMDEQKGAAGIEDVIDPLAKQEKAVATGAEAAAGRLEQEGAQLGGGMGAIESGEALRTAARAGKTAAQKEGGELFKDVPEFPIDAKNLINKIDEIAAPMDKFEAVGKNVPEEFATIKQILKDSDGIVTPKDLQGLRSNLGDVLDDAMAGQKPNKRLAARLSKLRTEVDDVLKKAGEASEQGDFATYKGDVVHPQQLTKELDEINVKLKAGDQLTDAKINVEETHKALREKNIPGIMRQKAEGSDSYAERLAKSYRINFKKEPPMIPGKEKAVITNAKARKTVIEETLAGAQAATAEVKASAAGDLKTAQTFWKKEVIDKFNTGTTGDILRKGKGGDKVSNAQIASRYFKPGSAGVEQANQFVESVGDNPQAREAIEDFIKQDLLSTATNPVTGEIIESKLKTWLTRYKPSLKKLGLENRFNTMVKASEELNKAKDMQVAFNKSVASKALNSDVDSVVKSVFATGSKRKAAERLMGKLKGDKKAIAGLQNSTIDHLITNAETTAVDAFNNPIVSLAGVEREFKKLKPAIDVLFKDAPVKLDALNKYRSALKIMQRGKASPLGGGSDTAENVITAMSKATGLSHSRTLNILKALTSPLREMGNNQVNAILNRAAFDPEFAQTIMMAAKGRPVKIIEQRLQSHLAALGLRTALKGTIDDNTNNK